jgi:hypothetical protein
MPLAAAIVPAVIGAGAAVYSASKASKAANKANAAQQAADDKALALQRENFDRIYGLNQPFVQGGLGAYNKLLQQFGITSTAQPGTAGTSPLEPGTGVPTTGATGSSVFAPSDAAALHFGTAAAAPTASAAPSAAPAAPSGPAYPGGPNVIPGKPAAFDAQAYLQQNPDVAANAQERIAAGTAQTPEQVAWEHYQTYGANENRAEPMTAATPDSGMPDYMNMVRPGAAPPPTFGDRQNLDAPDMASFFSNFEADPGAAYRRSEALNGVNAASAVRGKLRSGDAAKALATLASNLGAQEYNNWFNRQQTKFQDAQGAYQYGQGRADTNYGNDRAYGTSLWQNTRDFNNGNFNEDRGFAANRYDTNNANLFNLTDVGTRAAANVSGAGTNYANNAANIYGNSADSTANTAYNRAAANAYGANGVANAAGNLFANWGGSSSTLGGYSNPGSGYGQPGANPFTIF